MRDPWFQAFMVTPPRICGVQLLPYSVAHDYLLSHLGNPYVLTLPDATEAHLFELVAVCGRTWQENRAAFMGGGQAAFFGGLPRWVRRWSRRMDFRIADASVRTYLADYRLVAEHHFSKTPADPNDEGIAAPHHWHLVRCLCQHWGRTFDQAWDTAINEAKCCFDCWAESNGDDTLDSVLDMHVNDLCREADRLGKAGDEAGMEAKYAEVKSLCDMRQKARKERA